MASHTLQCQVCWPVYSKCTLSIKRILPGKQGDFPVAKMINGLPDVDPKRKAKLLDVLDIDLDWRMHLVSDGQRRRVQLLMGLLKPFQAGSQPLACASVAQDPATPAAIRSVSQVLESNN